MSRRSCLRTVLTFEAMHELLLLQISEAGEAAFQGRVGEDEFEVKKVNAYRSSYMPFARGRIVAHPGGTEIELSFRPHRQVLVFLAIWLAFLLLVSLLIVASALSSGPARLLLLPAPLGLTLLTWILSSRVFRSDCGWVTKALEDIIGEAEGKVCGGRQ